MSQISGPVTSVAQAQLTQKQRAAETDAAQEASDRRAHRQQRQQTESRDFVETMSEAAGLKVEPEEAHDSESRRKKRLQQQASQQKEQDKRPPTGDEARDHAAALLSKPGGSDGTAPPPCLIDVEA
jgi:hypothetical protein